MILCGPSKVVEGTSLAEIRALLPISVSFLESTFAPNLAGRPLIQLKHRGWLGTGGFCPEQLPKSDRESDVVSDSVRLGSELRIM